MSVEFVQLAPKDALRTYADWLLDQRVEQPFPFFRVMETGGHLPSEWYMVFYPLRGLLAASRVLGDARYAQAAMKYIDLYCGEQLPNGAFTSNFRRTPTASLTRKEFHEILRSGKVNLADNGSNVTGVIQAAAVADPERRQVYLNAARRWVNEWVPIWALPEGGYGNAIWAGHKLNGPYTCAMGTTSAALAAFGLATGEHEFIENAERCMMFQCSKWQANGRPINLDCYPAPFEASLDDFGHSFYLLEGMCWTHFASKNPEVRKRIESRLTEWIFGPAGLLSQWSGSWFSFEVSARRTGPGELPTSRFVRLGWEMAKSNGIMHEFLYYLRNIQDEPTLRAKVNLGVQQHLSHPLRARMSGVASDPEQTYGAFAVQSTGFALLSLAEEVEAGSAFRT